MERLWFHVSSSWMWESGVSTNQRGMKYNKNISYKITWPKNRHTTLHEFTGTKTVIVIVGVKRPFIMFPLLYKGRLTFLILEGIHSEQLKYSSCNTTHAGIGIARVQVGHSNHHTTLPLAPYPWVYGGDIGPIIVMIEKNDWSGILGYVTRTSFPAVLKTCTFPCS